jgi:hypothetical protein
LRGQRCRDIGHHEGIVARRGKAMAVACGNHRQLPGLHHAATAFDIQLQTATRRQHQLMVIMLMLVAFLLVTAQLQQQVVLVRHGAMVAGRAAAA